jgi:predicted nuclease of predicted toxin-antitoxin system
VNLFIELYLDEDMSTLVADLLRARGFSAITTLEAGQLGNADIAQLSYAVSNAKVLLTHNRADFEALARDYYESRRTHFGIIIAVRRTPHEIVRRLLPILNNITADEMKNVLRYM